MSQIDFDVEEGKALLLSKYEKCTSEDRVYGRFWYLRAHDFAQTLSVNYGCSSRQSSGVIAVLSPRNKWKDNKKDAENVIKAHSEGEDLNSVKLSSPYVKVEKCIRILEKDKNPDEILVQKSRSFYRCIYYPLTKEVCVDVHAARALNFRERWIPKKVYPLLQESYQLAAEELGLHPHVLQATIWIRMRNGRHE